MSHLKKIWNNVLALSLIVFSICVALNAQETGAQSVKVWEEEMTLPTYLVGAPEVNPVFYTNESYQGAQKRVYPYALIERLSQDRQDKTYKALYLENEYVQLIVLPEMGGRLFSALDKTNNYNFFYRQHVI